MTRPGKRRLLLLEPHSGGHHFASYLRFLARGMLARGWQPLVVTTERAARSRARRILEDEFGDKLPLLALGELDSSSNGDRWGLVKRQIRLHQWHRHAVRAACREGAIDGVFVMGFDGIGRATGVLGLPTQEMPTWGIAIGIRYHWPVYGIAPRRLSDLPSRILIERTLRRENMKSLFTIDPTYAEHAQRQARIPAGRVQLVPDPGELSFISTREEARRRLDLPETGWLILVYGSITTGKGISDLLAIIECLKKDGVLCRALLAGSLDAPATAVLHSQRAMNLIAAGYLRVREGYQSSSEEAALFSAADMVWVAYSSSFLKPSAVMSQACQAGRPVLARPEGLIGRAVKQDGHGMLIHPETTQEAAMVISRLMQDEKRYCNMKDRAEQRAPSCNAAAFANTICRAVEQTLD